LAEPFDDCGGIVLLSLGGFFDLLPAGFDGGVYFLSIGQIVGDGGVYLL
jgi:hypothetical protein